MSFTVAPGKHRVIVIRDLTRRMMESPMITVVGVRCEIRVLSGGGGGARRGCCDPLLVAAAAPGRVVIPRPGGDLLELQTRWPEEPGAGGCDRGVNVSTAGLRRAQGRAATEPAAPAVLR